MEPDRGRQSREYKELVQTVSQILFSADPIGINFQTNTDEYDSEAADIVVALPRIETAEELLAVVHEIFVRWFDPDTAGPPERYSDIATQIWRLTRSQ